MLAVLLLFAVPGSLAAPSLFSSFLGDAYFDPDPIDYLGMMNMAYRPAFAPLLPFSVVKRDICTSIDDIPGLKFPPYSEIPKDSKKEAHLVEESVKQSTYRCRDNDDKEFLVLTVSAIFATGNIRNKQYTANYYDSHKDPISHETLKIDHRKLWDFIQRQEERKARVDRLSKLQYSSWPSHSTYYSQHKTTDSSKCEPRKELEASKYPNIDVSDLGEDDKKETKHETYLCVDPNTGEKAILLKTSINITLKSGGVMNRSQTVLIPADKDGNPVKSDTSRPIQTETSQHVEKGTLTALSRDFVTRL